METALEELFVLSNPVGQEMAVWGDARLEIAYFLSSERPNERYVTSVRAVVLRGSRCWLCEIAMIHSMLFPAGGGNRGKAWRKRFPGYSGDIPSRGAGGG